MRIFDPKNQFGSSLLSSADTALSSKRLEKQMAVGGGAITLSSADISDIENWELCNASVVENGKTVSFLPETSKDEYGNITVVFGRYFENVILVLKRVEFGAMCEQEQLTIEVKIRRLMGRTMAAATATTSRTPEEVQQNIDDWKALGGEAVKEEPVKYPYAACVTQAELVECGFNRNVTVIGSDVCLASFDGFTHVSQPASVYRTFPKVQTFEADLPSLTNGYCAFYYEKSLQTFSGQIPNLQTANGMFYNCTKLTEWTVALPNSLTNAGGMFYNCTKLTEWTVALPNSLTNAGGMFQNCSGLKSFSTPSGTLPDSITDASYMFDGCTGLKSWSVALPNSLTNASYMFRDCFELREFKPSLAGLTNCESFSSMFQGCKLNEASIRNVLNTLPDQTGKTQPSISIGCDGTIEESKQNELSSLAQQVSTEKNYNISLTWNS